MNFRITMNDVGVFGALVDGEAAAMDLSPVMGAIAGDLLAISDGAFINMADPTTNAAWPELAYATHQERKKLFAE